MPPKAGSGGGAAGGSAEGASPSKAFATLDLTPQEVKDLRDMFDLMDKDKGGTLGIEEVKSLMELLGMKVRQDELEAMVTELDKDGSGQIDFDEFVQVMAKPQDLPYKQPDILRAFRMFADADAPPGCISPEALERALVKYCAGKAPEAELMRLVNSLELTQEGYIDYAKKAKLFLR